MKIGFFTDSYFPRLDGVAISVDTCAQALRARGHEVYIIAPRHPRYKDKDYDIYRLTSIKFPTVRGTPEARMALPLPEKPLLQVISLDFDIIHGHSTLSGITFLGLQIAKAKNIPYVTTYHTLWNRYTHYIFNGKIITPRMVEVLSKFMGNFGDCLIAPTERVKKELISYGIKKSIEVFPSGIDTKNFKKIEKGFIRKRTKIENDKKILLYCGRLGKEKSLDFIFDSFKLIHELDSQTVLVLIGEGPDLQKLKTYAKKLKIQKSVYFLGKIDHKFISQAYADANLFLFASQTETQGLVVLEALASGVPAVAVEDDALKNVIFNGKNGFLVKKDPKLFAKKVIKLINDKKLYKKFSLAAQKKAEKFSAEKTAKRLEKLYSKLIAEKNSNQTKNNINYSSLTNFFVKTNQQIKKYYAYIDQY